MKAFSHRILAGGLAMAAITGTAFAGEKVGQEVVFSAVKPSVYGDLGFVRNTADTIQYIGCSVQGAGGVCIARNSAGVIHMCSTTDPDILNNIRALNGDSRLSFGWNPDGTCKLVSVQNDSRQPPK